MPDLSFLRTKTVRFAAIYCLGRKVGMLGFLFGAMKTLSQFYFSMLFVWGRTTFCVKSFMLEDFIWQKVTDGSPSKHPSILNSLLRTMTVPWFRSEPISFFANGLCFLAGSFEPFKYFWLFFLREEHALCWVCALSSDCLLSETSGLCFDLVAIFLLRAFFLILGGHACFGTFGYIFDSSVCIRVSLCYLVSTEWNRFSIVSLKFWTSLLSSALRVSTGSGDVSTRVWFSTILTSLAVEYFGWISSLRDSSSLLVTSDSIFCLFLSCWCLTTILPIDCIDLDGDEDFVSFAFSGA